MTKAINKRVMIVDDERELTDTLALRLAAEGGFTVSVAYNGAEGLREAAVFKPDIILLDITMPVVDGWEMCRRLRDNPDTRHIPVVMMTAWSGNGVREDAHAQGVSKILLKPLEERELLSALRSS